MKQSMDWFKGNSEPENIDFPIEYVLFPLLVPLNQSIKKKSVNTLTSYDRHIEA